MRVDTLYIAHARYLCGRNIVTKDSTRTQAPSSKVSLKDDAYRRYISQEGQSECANLLYKR